MKDYEYVRDWLKTKPELKMRVFTFGHQGTELASETVYKAIAAMLDGKPVSNGKKELIKDKTIEQYVEEFCIHVSKGA